MRLFLVVALLLFAALSFPFAGTNVFLETPVNNSLKLLINPATVTVFGDFQIELGCSGDFQTDFLIYYAVNASRIEIAI